MKCTDQITGRIVVDKPQEELGVRTILIKAEGVDQHRFKKNFEYVMQQSTAALYLFKKPIIRANGIKTILVCHALQEESAGQALQHHDGFYRAKCAYALAPSKVSQP